jgi:glycosyltransferase involved in cell wall biosynthesis
MSEKRKSVCLISSGIHTRNLRLQPWRYLHEVGIQLADMGHRVTILTDDTPDGRIESSSTLQIREVANVNHFRWRSNPAMQQALHDCQADAVIWHLGLPSFVHQNLDLGKETPIVGIYPGLIYRPSDFKKLGMRKVLKSFQMVQIHLMNAAVPRGAVRRAVQSGQLKQLVVLSETTRQQLIRAGVQPEGVKVIGPGVDLNWLQAHALNGKKEQTRMRLGYQPQDKVILYYGSPHPLRGMHDLLRAFEIAQQQEQALRLLILSRRREDELIREDAELKELLKKSAIRGCVKVVNGYLDVEQLMDYMAASDAVALPFQLVPADGPLSILEAQAQGKAVITTGVGSLPEMVAGGKHFLAEPANPVSLAQAVLAAAHNTAEKTYSRPANVRSWQQVGEEWSELIQRL